MNIKTYHRFFLSIFIAFFHPVSTSHSADVASSELKHPVIQLSSSQIRTFKTGDAISYTSTIAGSGAALSGDITQTVGTTVINPAGKKCLEHKISTTYTGIGGPLLLDIRRLYFQDANNSIYECGLYDDSKEEYVFITDTENTLDGLAIAFQSPMKPGNSTSILMTYTNGSWKDCTRSVVSTEHVTTAIGVYESYKIKESCTTDADSSTTETTLWFVPEIYTIKESGAGDFIAGDFVLKGFAFE